MEEKNFSNAKRDFLSISLMFFLISFIGWAFETVLCFFQSGEYCDRGFLTLPFCPIYGAPVCFVFFLFGRPSDGLFYRLIGGEKSKSRGQSRDFRKFRSVIIYYFAAMMVATAVELVVGVAFDSAGLSLWSYNGVPFCFMEVVCLPVSLGWGFLITFFAQFILPAFERGILKLPRRLKTWLVAILWTATLADFLYNGAYFLLNKRHFRFFR